MASLPIFFTYLITRINYSADRMKGLLHSGYTGGDPRTGFWQVVVAASLLDEFLQPVREKGRDMSHLYSKEKGVMGN